MTIFNKCTGCHRKLPEHDFSFKNKSTGYRQSKCKKCYSNILKVHYMLNKEGYIHKYKYRAKQIKSNIASIKSSKPCLDCGVAYPYYVMDFDHRPGELKTADISVMIRAKMAYNSILTEISKCDLVCANCHRVRTFICSKRPLRASNPRPSE